MLPIADPRLLVGLETLDDAAVLRVSEEVAICFTADFLTPIVDTPSAWGQIAAANSLSDIYAMGATPLAALNLVCWPKCLPMEMLREILEGGSTTATDAGCLVVGGHTVDDKEPKYGMAVIGTVHPDRVLRNQGALPGDGLYVSKSLGTGIVATAIKADLAADEEIAACIDSMSMINRVVSEAAVRAGAHALTDVTGFGLAGHLLEMLPSPNDRSTSSPVGVRVYGEALPLLQGAVAHMEMGLIPAGAYRNRETYQTRVLFHSTSSQSLEMLLFDPQTSGGLLAAIPADKATEFERICREHSANVVCIGQFDTTGMVNVI